MKSISVVVLDGDKNEEDDYQCACGNSIMEDGFCPCDSDGKELEPDVNSDWQGLYVCCKCGKLSMIERKSKNAEFYC